MELERFSETLLSTYKSTRRYIPEDNRMSIVEGITVLSNVSAKIIVFFNAVDLKSLSVAQLKTSNADVWKVKV
jgi:hypothetical protein